MIAAGWKAFRSPFLPLTLALIAGILLGELIPSVVSLYAIGLLLCVCMLLWSMLWRRRLFLTQFLVLFLVLAAGAFLIQRAINPAIPPNHVSLIPDREKVTLTGTILLPPQREAKETVFYLQTEEVSLGNTTASGTGKVRITIRDPAVPLQYGYRVRLLVKLYHPRNFKNPGSFDYAGYLRRQGVLVTGYVRDGAQVQILSTEGGNPLLRWFDRRRQEIAAFLDATTSLPGKGFLKAVLIGERGDISREVNDAFVATGTVHILSISGSPLHYRHSHFLFRPRTPCVIGALPPAI